MLRGAVGRVCGGLEPVCGASGGGEQGGLGLIIEADALLLRA
jgi:hypothetical protein